MTDIGQIMAEYRRRAYVDTLMKMKTEDNVIGIFGEGIDETFLYAYGLVVIPIVGMDSYIFEYGEYDSCDTIRSTIIYMKTGKCPLLFSSKMYLLSDVCTNIYNAFCENTDKVVEVYSNNQKLSSVIERVYKRKFDNNLYNVQKQRLQYIENLYEKIENSNLSMKEKFMLNFFSKYIISLDEIITFLDDISKNLSLGNKNKKSIYTPCPYGIYENISNQFEKDILLKQGIKNIDIACKGCMYDAPLYINY
jgi:hypothetical protein